MGYLLYYKNKIMSEIVLAFDIEHTGLEIIGIGASVVDSNFAQLDSFFMGIYHPEETKFSERCWNTFWTDHLSILENLKYKGEQLTKEAREAELITKFQQFRAKCEESPLMNGRLVMVSDNNVFDGGLINTLIREYLPDTEPIPYSASRDNYGNQKYQSFWETFSQQKGLMASVDQSFKSDWGLSDRIFELYDVKKPSIKHDHNPANDAYTIAYDQQIIFGVRDGRIYRRP